VDQCFYDYYARGGGWQLERYLERLSAELRRDEAASSAASLF
jgi:hypothetical protein